MERGVGWVLMTNRSEGYLSGARKSVVWGSGVIGVLALVAGSVVGVF